MTSTSRAASGGSAWSVVALVSAVVAFVGVFSFSTLTFAAPPAALLALVAGALGVIRDRRILWRVVAGLSAVATLALVVLTGIVVYVLSGGGPTL